MNRVESLRNVEIFPAGRRGNGRGRRGSSGTRREHHTTVLGVDVSQDYPGAEQGHFASSVSIHSHNVDANESRCDVFVRRFGGAAVSTRRSAVAHCDRTAWDDMRLGNTTEPERFSAGATVRHRKRNKRRGQALLEMALMIPLIVILIGATISFGLFFFQSNVLQQAVDVAAQEIARTPFSPTGELGLGNLDADFTLDNGLLMNDSDFRERIYNEQYLVIEDGDWGPSSSFGGDFRAYADQLPLLNRLLVPVMIRDDSLGNVLRYPGAVVNNSQTGEQSVLIPIVGYSSTGEESVIEWVAPVEEIVAPDGARPYSLDATSSSDAFVAGLVALRINYPAQSTTLVNRVGAEGQTIVDADDSSVSDGDTGSAYTLAVGNESGAADTRIHSGRFGLGRQAALFRSAGVRPYRKVLSVQAIYRREVFE